MTIISHNHTMIMDVFSSKLAPLRYSHDWHQLVHKGDMYILSWCSQVFIPLASDVIENITDAVVTVVVPSCHVRWQKDIMSLVVVNGILGHVYNQSIFQDGSMKMIRL